MKRMPSPPLSVWPVVNGMSDAVMPTRKVPCARAGELASTAAAASANKGLRRLFIMVPPKVRTIASQDRAKDQALAASSTRNQFSPVIFFTLAGVVTLFSAATISPYPAGLRGTELRPPAKIG